MWGRKQAIALCKQIEEFSPEFGAHVALTGGLLYKEGRRKDCDILFYRHRTFPEIRKKKLLEEIGKKTLVQIEKDFGFVVKAKIGKLQIDFFFPEGQDGLYEEEITTEDETEGALAERIPIQIPDELEELRERLDQLRLAQERTTIIRNILNARAPELPNTI